MQRTIEQGHAVVGLTVETPGAITFRRKELPKLVEGEFLAKNIRSGVSPGTELIEITRPPKSKIGYAVSAVVAETNGTKSVREGDRLGMKFGHWTGGVMREEEADKWIPLPQAIDDELGTLSVQMGLIANIGLLTAANAVHGTHLVKELAGSLRGQLVAINGAGPIGLQVGEAVLNYGGAERVIMVDDQPSRLQRAADLGMQTVNFRKEDPFEVLRREYSEPRIINGANLGPGPDIYYNTAANGPALQTVYRSLRTQGWSLDMAFYGSPITIEKGADFHVRGIRDIGTQVDNIPYEQQPYWTRRRLMRVGQEIVQNRPEHIRKALFSHREDLSDAPKVYRDYDARNPQRMITLFKMDEVDESRLPIDREFKVVAAA